MICDSAPFDFHFQSLSLEEVLVIGQIKVVRSCQLKRDLSALEHSLQLRKTGGEELRIVKMAKLHLCRRSKCISFFLAKKKKKEQPKTYNFLQRNSTKQFGSF